MGQLSQVLSPLAGHNHSKQTCLLGFCLHGTTAVLPHGSSYAAALQAAHLIAASYINSRLYCVCMAVFINSMYGRGTIYFF